MSFSEYILDAYYNEITVPDGFSGGSEWSVSKDELVNCTDALISYLNSSSLSGVAYIGSYDAEPEASENVDASGKIAEFGDIDSLVSTAEEQGEQFAQNITEEETMAMRHEEEHEEEAPEEEEATEHEEEAPEEEEATDELQGEYPDDNYVVSETDDEEEHKKKKKQGGGATTSKVVKDATTEVAKTIAEVAAIKTTPPEDSEFKDVPDFEATASDLPPPPKDASDLPPPIKDLLKMAADIEKKEEMDRLIAEDKEYEQSYHEDQEDAAIKHHTDTLTDYDRNQFYIDKKFDLRAFLRKKN